MSKDKGKAIQTNMSLRELREFARKFQPRPKRVYYSKKDRVVAIVWSDKTRSKTICSRSDKFDLEMGIAMCIAKKMVKPDQRKNLLEKAISQPPRRSKKDMAEFEPDSSS